MTNLKKIERGNLSEQVYSVIRDTLIEGKYAPGERLRINPLAEELGVSITPVREAIFRLVSEHALEMKAAKAQGATTMCITSFPDSPLVRYADVKLFTPTATGPSGSADYHESMVSKIAQLQVIDVLYSLYAVRNFGSAIAGLDKTSDVTSLTRY